MIDWAGYDEPTIRKELEKWGKDLRRPAGVECSARTGKGIQPVRDLREMLFQLGASRIYAGLLPSLVRSRAKEAFEWLTEDLNDTGPASLQKSLDGRKRRLIRTFRSLLPFEKSAPLFIQSSRLSARNTSGPSPRPSH